MKKKTFFLESSEIHGDIFFNKIGTRKNFVRIKKEKLCYFCCNRKLALTFVGGSDIRPQVFLSWNSSELVLGYYWSTFLNQVYKNLKSILSFNFFKQVFEQCVSFLVLATFEGRRGGCSLRHDLQPRQDSVKKLLKVILELYSYKSYLIFYRMRVPAIGS